LAAVGNNNINMLPMTTATMMSQHKSRDHEGPDTPNAYIYGPRTLARAYSWLCKPFG
jgi:hypothetical protein